MSFLLYFALASVFLHTMFKGRECIYDVCITCVCVGVLETTKWEKTKLMIIIVEWIFFAVKITLGRILHYKKILIRRSFNVSSFDSLITSRIHIRSAWLCGWRIRRRMKNLSKTTSALTFVYKEHGWKCFKWANDLNW